jgi:hypothetical protein
MILRLRKNVRYRHAMLIPKQPKLGPGGLSTALPRDQDAWFASGSPRTGLKAASAIPATSA